ncbi:DNA repair ATPase [Secundilactobacillus kimchicus JCM 15530]|uniref:DNA repair protein RecN n=1 Tax=Secundilactobacillus kimchicus JCM 15530 TaxID=1302272 RepID=A0A0R1HR04_9LACO|nr:DNA repair protein RecN [Secundilactobacillus kimchicus]KRK49277.1 DNA repair ATPase [Secundilactobacillus kimchicus JCM 15530]
MLQELSIKNFAIIAALDVTFEDGMTVLTGETGAGKSIIIDAVGLLAGGRGSAHFIRTGADKAVLQGSFELPKAGKTTQMLDDLGIDHDDGTVILQRELYRTGRNVCRVNGMLVNTTTLKQIGETIVDIHGQNEHQELMQPDRHLPLLDEFGGHDLKTLLQRYRKAYANYQKLHEATVNRNTHQKEWAQRLDMLRFQVKEIETANLSAGEEDQLRTQRDRLTNFQKINVALQEGFTALEGSDELSGAVDLSGQAMNALAGIAELDADFQALYDSLQTAFYALQDASGELSKQVDLLEFDENKLDEIEQRLEVIKQLERKYGDSESQVLSYFAKIKVELADMEAAEIDEGDLDAKLAEQATELEALGIALREKRQTVARKLEVAVQKELADLYMEKTVFKVHFSPVESGRFLSSGLDDVEFYIQPNPGEAMQPLAKIASGGELSRLMLALKTIFSKSQGVTSIIFDEVDTGVSGRVAQAIAEKISGIANDSQVLCITHLPQVAAMSDHHYFIAKKIIGKRTETHITKLTEQARIEELARMLAGTTITELTLDHAKELLEMATAEKAES